MTNTSMSLKMAMNDRLSIGLQHYDAEKLIFLTLGLVGRSRPLQTPMQPSDFSRGNGGGDGACGNIEAAVAAYAATAMAGLAYAKGDCGICACK